MDFDIVLKRETILGTGVGLCNGLLKTQMFLRISKTNFKKKKQSCYGQQTGTLRISIMSFALLPGAKRYFLKLLLGKYEKTYSIFQDFL